MKVIKNIPKKYCGITAEEEGTSEDFWGYHV